VTPPAATADADDDDEIEDDDHDADADDVDEAIEVPAPAPRPPFKAGTRQPAKADSKPTGDLPWWARVKPGEMTKVATEKADEMSKSHQGQQLKSDRNLGR